MPTYQLSSLSFRVIGLHKTCKLAQQGQRGKGNWADKGGMMDVT